MKTIYILVIGLLATTILNAQSCLPNGITLNTQAQIDKFKTDYPGCNRIDGRLTISGKDITNLNGLSQLTSLNGVYIYNNNSLTSLYGLHNVTSVYSLHIGEYHTSGNPLLTSLTGLDALTHISDDLEIYDNNALTSLSGLDNLTFIGRSLSISKNEVLSSIASLKKLSTAGRGIAILNTALTSLKGLENVTDVRGGIDIAQNPVLTSISGLEKIVKDSLTALWIHNNPVLVTCNLPNLCNYLKNPGGSVSIHNNATGCNSPVEMARECGISIPCLPKGNYYFLSQSDINNFRINYPDCKDLGGNVYIRGNDIVSLNGLNRVRSIKGDLNIDSCRLLGSLKGLDSLTTVGNSVYIASNDALSNLAGLDNLKSVGWGLRISHNPLLTNLSGLEKLTSTGGGLDISDNKVLTSLKGLDNISSTSWIQILDNPKLTSIASLKNVTSVIGNFGDLWIWNNYALESLDGLNNITSVGNGQLWIEGNTVLKDLKGLKKLTTIKGSLEIAYNPALTSLSGLENLTTIGFDLWLYYNDSIRNCNGLENLSSLGRDLWIFGNPSLISLKGLENIDTTSISSLYISENSLLSTCEVKSICAYLAKPDGTVEISLNAPGCNSKEEVKKACAAVCTVNTSENKEICNGESYQGWTLPGIYKRTLKSKTECDSIVTTNLSIFNAYKPEIALSGDTLSSVNQYKTYQWYNNAEMIPGANERKFIIQQSGKYRLLIMDDNGCKNTSDLISAIHSDVISRQFKDFRYSIIPNPNSGIFTFRTDSYPKQEFTLKLLNSTGQVIEIRPVISEGVNHIERFDVSHLGKGFYLLFISTEKHQACKMIVFQ
jgi:hypothetical protein